MSLKFLKINLEKRYQRQDPSAPIAKYPMNLGVLAYNAAQPLSPKSPLKQGKIIRSPLGLNWR
jgi:hypothetical protein